MEILENKLILMNCINSFNKCTLEWVDTFYSKELVWIEYPTNTSPNGRKGKFMEFREAAIMRLKLFPQNTLELVQSICEGDKIVFDQNWKGIMGLDGGGYKKGDEIKMKIVTIFKMKDGLIIEHTDFPILIK
jgi:hypothetical protein